MQEKNISIIDAMIHPFECLNKFSDEGAVFFYQVLVYDISNNIYTGNLKKVHIFWEDHKFLQTLHRRL
jgi:hypothetical protein